MLLKVKRQRIENGEERAGRKTGEKTTPPGSKDGAGRYYSSMTVCLLLPLSFHFMRDFALSTLRRFLF